MKIVKTGSAYRFFGEEVETFDKLPAGFYNICAAPMQGMWLEKSDDLKVEEKVYGSHQLKAEKVVKKFKNGNRQLGVILSGLKGIGKSLCAKLICIEAVKNGYPVIMCNCKMGGLVDFLGDIKQEIVVMFDEFEKNFKSDEGQQELLTLFDGFVPGKRLFVITCNEIRNLNDFLVNRPGRFHYHFRFDCPEESEIRAFIEDKIGKDRENEVRDVIAFSKRTQLNYDCLRAIASELADGYSFKEAIKDLNIVNYDRRETYNVILKFTNGETFVQRKYPVDLFGWDDENEGEELYMEFYSKDRTTYIETRISLEKPVYDNQSGMYLISPEDVRVIEYAVPDPERPGRRKDTDFDKQIEYIGFKRVFENTNIHYAI